MEKTDKRYYWGLQIRQEDQDEKPFDGESFKIPKDDLQAAIRRIEDIVSKFPQQVPQHFKKYKQELLEALSPKSSDGTLIFLQGSTPETRLADLLACCNMSYEWMVLLYGKDLVTKMQDHDSYKMNFQTKENGLFQSFQYKSRSYGTF